MRHLNFIFFTAISLLFLSSCSKEGEESIDLDNMVMEDDDILEDGNQNDLFFTPQEVIVKETPETQAVEGQR